MRQTSLEAWWTLDKAKVNKRQQQVLDDLEEIFPATNRMIAQHSQIPINVVTPRMGELVRKGLVIQAFTGMDATGRRAIFWQPKTVVREFADVA